MAGASSTIAICMATYNPNPELFDVQIRSLLAQTDERWLCLISDDCSDPDRFEQIEALSRRDPRFVVSRSDRRLGFYRNFERALSLVPAEVELVALCDQDDRWYPDKLKTLRAQLGDAQLVYSDQRLVDAGGRIIRETMWRGRSNNHTNLASMLIANTITGAAMLFRRELLGLALPFPDTPGLQFHDHWLALVALAAGEVAYVDRALYDYVQHPEAIFGEVTGGRPRGRTRSSGSRAWLAARSRGWRAAYFCGYLSRAVQARTLLVRCGSSLTPGKRRALERYLASERSPVWFAWLVARPLRRLAGRNETLGSELELVPGILWRRLIPICAKLSTLARRRSCDATYPDPLDFEQRRLRRWRAEG
jgi:glycosyltransferase involved in cell wall biosynthesis